jgi:hypothetical protein
MGKYLGCILCLKRETRDEHLLVIRVLIPLAILDLLLVPRTRSPCLGNHKSSVPASPDVLTGKKRDVVGQDYLGPFGLLC